MDMRIWIPRDVTAHDGINPDMIRVYFADGHYAQARWQSRRPMGSYETHRAAKGESFGAYIVEWNGTDPRILDIATRYANVVGVHFGGDSDDENIFRALCDLIETPQFLGNKNARAGRAKIFAATAAPFRGELNNIGGNE